MAERLTGTVKFFHAGKGFGFIAPDDGSPDLFTHADCFVGEGYKTLQVGDRVSFDLGKNKKGPRAVHVKVLGLVDDVNEENWHQHIGPVPDKD